MAIGLERSELGGSHGCPGCLWDRFLWLALGSHEIRPIHSAPSLGQSGYRGTTLIYSWLLLMDGPDRDDRKKYRFGQVQPVLSFQWTSPLAWVINRIRFSIKNKIGWWNRSFVLGLDSPQIAFKVVVTGFWRHQAVSYGVAPSQFSRLIQCTEKRFSLSYPSFLCWVWFW